MAVYDLAHVFDAVDIAGGGHLVGNTQDQLSGEQVDQLLCLLLQHFQGIHLVEQQSGDAVYQAHLVPKGRLDLLYRHIPLGHGGHGLDGVQARLLGVGQDGFGVTVPVGEGVVAFVRLVEQLVAVLVLRQDVLFEQGGGQGGAVDVVAEVDPLEAAGADHLDKAVVVGRAP